MTIGSTNARAPGGRSRTQPGHNEAAATFARGMAEKPRVRAPKQRTTSGPDSAAHNRRIALVAVAALVGVAAVGMLFVLVASGSGKPSEESVRTGLEEAGCTFQAVKAGPAAHSVRDPGGVSKKWNTDPPTNGPHYSAAAIFGVYEDPLEPARVVHNLEHGGIFVQYGDDVPETIVEQLRAFYNDHKTGTIMAPLPALGDQFALGAWVAEGEEGKGYLTKCAAYDEGAVSAFFDAFQFVGPERFDPSQLQPGN